MTTPHYSLQPCHGWAELFPGSQPFCQERWSLPNSVISEWLLAQASASLRQRGTGKLSMGKKRHPIPYVLQGWWWEGGGGCVLRGRKPQAVWVVVNSPRCLWGRIGILEGKMGKAGGWEGSPDPCLQQCSSAKVYSWPIPWVCWSSASVPPSADVPLSTHSLVFLLAPSCRTGTLALGCVTLWCVRGH